MSEPQYGFAPLSAHGKGRGRITGSSQIGYGGPTSTDSGTMQRAQSGKSVLLCERDEQLIGTRVECNCGLCRRFELAEKDPYVALQVACNYRRSQTPDRICCVQGARVRWSSGRP